MGTPLTGNTIASSYFGLLKSTDSLAISTSPKTITDGVGNDLPIKLSTTQFLVSDGSASVPTIGFSNDVDTGFFYSTNKINATIGGTTKFELGSSSLKLSAYGSGSITGTVTQRLGVTSSGEVVEIPIGAGALDGSGTAGKLAKFTDSDTLGDSILSESSTVITNTGVFRTSTGNAGSPAYSFTSNTNTGMFVDGTNLKLGYAGVVALTIDANSDVLISSKLGVGIATTPSEKLEVSGNIHLSTASSTISAFGDLVLDFDNSKLNNRTFKITSDDGDNTLLTLLESGSLGLGTTSPNEKFEISSGNIRMTNGNQINFGNGDVYIQGTTASDNIQLGLTGSTKFTFAQLTGLRMHDYGSGNITGTVAQKLGVDSSGNVIEIPIGGGAVDGSGSANTVTMWTDSDTIGNAPITISSNDATFAGKILASNDAPAFAFASDTETGMARTGTHQIAFKNNDVDSLTLASDLSATFAGDVTLGDTSSENRTLSLQTNSEKDTVINFKEGSNLFGYSIGYYGVANDFIIKRHDNSASGTAVLTLNREDNNALFAGSVSIRKSSLGGTTAMSDGTLIFGAGSTNYFSFRLDASADLHLDKSFSSASSTVLTIDRSTSNIGIGTTSPSEILHIQGSANGNVKALIENTNTGTNAYATLGFQSDQSHSVHPALFLNGANNTNYAGANSLNMYQFDSFPLGFVTNNLLRMIVAGNGNVGIGTTSITSGFRLDVQGGDFRVGDDANQGLEGGYSAGAGVAFLQGFNRGTSAFIDLLIGTNVTIKSTGNVGIGTTSPSELLTLNKASGAVGILLEGNGTDVGKFKVASAGVNHALQIGTISNNEVQFHTNDGEKMRIHQDGKVGIGKTPSTYHLEVESSDLNVSLFEGSRDFGLAFVNTSVDSGLSQMQLIGINASNSYNELHLRSAVGTGIVIDTSNNVGIGTSTPSNILSIKSSSGSSKGIDIFHSNGNKVAELIHNGSGDEGMLRLLDSNSETVRIAGENDVDSYINSGNLGIGTTSPASKLEVESTTNGEVARFVSSAGNPGGDTGSAYLGIDSFSGTTNPACLIGVLEESVASFRHDFQILLKSASATDNSPTERFRIDGGTGNVGVGISSPESKLHIQDSTDRTMQGTGVGQFQISGNAYDFGIAMGAVGTAIYHNSPARSLIFGTDETSRMTINGSGTVNVVGTFTAGTKTFRIKHPLANKKETHDLVHSCIESPQADNIYRGKVDLVDGKAEINIDQVSSMTEGTFVALNRDIQCFTSNESDWDNVKGKVDGNILTIECQNSSSTATISWLVIGERQDDKIYESDLTDDNGKIIVEPFKEEIPQI